MYVQFETIHPFLDGNGRIVRLLIVLMLMNNDLLKLPVLYPSYYFKKYHFEYYQKLDRVGAHGDFEGWIYYYLKIIRDSAIDAYKRVEEIENLETKLRKLIHTDPGFSKIKETASQVLDVLFSQPITGIAEVSQKLGKAYNTIQKSLNEFLKQDLISENILHKRNKIYRFEPYLVLLEKEFSTNNS